MPCAFATEDDRGVKSKILTNIDRNITAKNLAGNEIDVDSETIEYGVSGSGSSWISGPFLHGWTRFSIRVETELLSGDYSMYGRIKVTPTARLGGEVGIE